MLTCHPEERLLFVVATSINTPVLSSRPTYKQGNFLHCTVMTGRNSIREMCTYNTDSNYNIGHYSVITDDPGFLIVGWDLISPSESPQSIVVVKNFSVGWTRRTRRSKKSRVSYLKRWKCFGAGEKYGQKRRS